MGTVFRTSIVLCLIGNCWILAAQLPEFFKKCKEDDVACIKESVHNGLRHMKNGIPNLKVPPIDPMRAPKFNVSAGEKIFKAEAYYKDIDIYGQSNGDLKEIVFDLKKNAFKLVLDMPVFRFTGYYELEGEIMGEKVKSSGKSDHRLKHLTLYTTCKLDRFKKGGDEYLKLTNCRLYFGSQHMKLYFEGLPKDLNDKFLKHQKEFFDDIQAQYGDDYVAVVSMIVNAFLENIPTTELFLK